MRRGLLRWRRPLVVPPAVSCPPPVAAERVASATRVWPRLRIWHDRYSPRCRWDWLITTPRGDVVGRGSAATHREALAVGLANLAVHTATWAIDVHGTELPTGWEKITP